MRGHSLYIVLGERVQAFHTMYGLKIVSHNVWWQAFHTVCIVRMQAFHVMCSPALMMASSSLMAGIMKTRHRTDSANTDEVINTHPAKWPGNMTQKH